MIRNRSMRAGICLCAAFLIISILFLSSDDLQQLFFSKRNSDRTSINSRTRLNSAQSFNCPVRATRWIVVTTIFYPTDAIHKFLSLSSPWYLIVIADRKTPKDWLSRLKFNTSRVIFISIEEQSSLNFRILDYLPYGSYARKNLGYLLAIQCGAELIFESDDDNFVEGNDIFVLPKLVQPQDVPSIAFHRERSPFVNIYGSFGHSEIWPRGFPVDEIRNVTEDGWHSVRENRQSNTPAYIQQYLADLDPDVDALVGNLSFFFTINDFY